MSEVTLSGDGVTQPGHDPSAVDGSAADQRVLGEIQADQRVTGEVVGQQIMNDLASMFGGPQAMPVPPSANPGPGYNVSPEELQAVINQFTAKVDRLNSYERRARQMIEVDFAPAQDEAGSRMHAKALRRSWQDIAAKIQADRDEAQAVVDLFTRTKQEYLARESLTEQQWQRLTLGLKP